LGDKVSRREVYYNLLVPRGLELWGDEFPEYAEKIRQKLALGALHYDSMIAQELRHKEGVHFTEGCCNVAGFTDCKYYKTTWVVSQAF
jgi:hypothetical protein